jgi:carbon storage regulator CsrA
MLVLSRKKDQKVILPGLDVTIQVVRCKTSGVTLGIEAPPQIRVLREELQVESSETFDSEVFRELLEQRVQSLPQQFRHDWRDRLNTLTIALHMLSDQIDAGEFTSADEAYDELIKLLTESANQGTRDEALSGEELSSDEVHREATVLLVEDQANEREMLAGILRMHGYSVATAHDGISALEYLENNEPPEFVLVDIQMPGCDGAEVVRQIRESERLSELSVYVVSGQQKEDYKISNDVDHWFMKPVDPKRLLNSMSDVGSRKPTTIAVI